MTAPGIPEGDGVLTATLDTSMGTIVLKLFEAEAPKTVANFVGLATGAKEWRHPKSGQKMQGHPLYDGTAFHRVIPNFMIQGGGFTPEMVPKPGTKAAIKNEAGNGLRNDRGTLAMARTNVVDSATAQFFINVVNNDFLNHRDESPQGFGYAVFGKVVEGMDVVDKIAATKTGMKNMFRDVPQTPIVIKSMKVAAN